MDNGLSKTKDLFSISGKQGIKKPDDSSWISFKRVSSGLIGFT